MSSMNVSMMKTLMRKEDELQFSTSIHEDILLLEDFYPIPSELKAEMRPDMFVKGTVPAFCQSLYYLFNIINVEETKKRFLWPVIDKPRETQFRRDTVEYLNDLNEKYAMGMPEVKAYMVVQPGGMRTMKVVDCLLDLVMKLAVDRHSTKWSINWDSFDKLNPNLPTQVKNQTDCKRKGFSMQAYLTHKDTSILKELSSKTLEPMLTSLLDVYATDDGHKPDVLQLGVVQMENITVARKQLEEKVNFVLNTNDLFDDVLDEIEYIEKSEEERNKAEKKNRQVIASTYEKIKTANPEFDPDNLYGDSGNYSLSKLLALSSFVLNDLQSRINSYQSQLSVADLELIREHLLNLKTRTDDAKLQMDEIATFNNEVIVKKDPSPINLLWQDLSCNICLTPEKIIQKNVESNPRSLFAFNGEMITMPTLFATHVENPSKPVPLKGNNQNTSRLNKSIESNSLLNTIKKRLKANNSKLNISSTTKTEEKQEFYNGTLKQLDFSNVSDAVEKTPVKRKSISEITENKSDITVSPSGLFKSDIHISREDINMEATVSNENDKKDLKENHCKEFQDVMSAAYKSFSNGNYEEIFTNFKNSIKADEEPVDFKNFKPRKFNDYLHLSIALHSVREEEQKKAKAAAKEKANQQKGETTTESAAADKQNSEVPIGKVYHLNVKPSDYPSDKSVEYYEARQRDRRLSQKAAEKAAREEMEKPIIDPENPENTILGLNES